VTEPIFAPPSTPPPTPQSPRRRAGLVLGLVGILGVLAVGGVATWRMITLPWVETTESVTLQAQVPRLAVDLGSGDLTVGRAAGDIVEIVRTVRSRGAAEPEYSETASAEGVAIAAECDGWFGGCDVDYEVRVPDGFALDLQVSSGRIEAGGMQVESANIRSSSGDVHLADVSGPVSLEVSSGEVTAERLVVPTFTARSSSGDLSVDFAAAPSAVDVNVSSGEVAVALPSDGRYRFQVETSAGEKSVSVPSDPAASSTVRIESSSGDVTVRSR
jgi:Putative adhesin